MGLFHIRCRKITQSTEMCRWRKSVWKGDAGNQSKFRSEILGEHFPVHLFFVVSLVVSGSVDHRMDMTAAIKVYLTTSTILFLISCSSTSNGVSDSVFILFGVMRGNLVVSSLVNVLHSCWLSLSAASPLLSV